MFFETDNLQWCNKKVENTFEFVEVVEGGEEYGFIKAGTINLSDYDENQITKFIEPYGYNTIEFVKESYKEDYLRIIAECIFETEFHPITPIEDLVHAKSILASDYGIDLSWSLTDLIWVSDEGYITSEDVNMVKNHTPETLRLFEEGTKSTPVTQSIHKGVYEGVALEGENFYVRFAKNGKLEKHTLVI